MARSRRVPTRTCVACRTVREKRDLVRVVRTADGRVILDEGGRIAGRGAYLCADGQCWTTALDRGALSRALAVPIPADLRARLQAGLTTTPTTTIHMTINGGPDGQE
jgi:predicted RNA-binding protein YlxR (DUF448 family)